MPMTDDDVTSAIENQVLAGLPKAQLAVLMPHLEPVDLRLRDIIEHPGSVIPFIIFPRSGILSVVAVAPDGERIEAGFFGRDGMSGLAVVMGADQTPHETMVQHAGCGLRISTPVLREVMAEHPEIRDRFLLFGQAFAVQTAHTALANGRHTIERRLARWLLMAQDRLDSGTLDLTHEFLSMMLGVRRAGVTVAIQVLEGQGLIKATRGRIAILNREGLEVSAQGIYGVPEAEHARLMGAPVAF